MTLAEFEQSIKTKAPLHDLAPALAALWWAKKGDWDQAHTIVMKTDGRDAAWVHAHLHRVEGDAGNAAYWYRQAKRPVATGALDAEWQAIATALLVMMPGRGREVVAAAGRLLYFLRRGR